MTRTFTISKHWLFCLAFLLPQITASALDCKNGAYVNLNGNGEATAPAEYWVLNTGSCCNGGDIFEISLDFGVTYQASATFNCDQLGVQATQIRVTDCFGVQSICQTFAVIQDNHEICLTGCGGCCLPEVRFKPALLSLSDNGTVTALADWFDDGSFSNCAAGDVQISFSQNTTDVLKTFSCDELGTQPVEIWATDAAGNQAMASVFVVIQDPFSDCPSNGGCLPVPVILNGLITTLGPDGTTCISSDIFNAGCQTDPCNVGTSFSLSFSDDPTVTEICFTCDDLGTQPVDVYIHDELGNTNVVYTFVVVQDVSEYCDPSIPIIAAPNDDFMDATSIDPLINAVCAGNFFNKSATVVPNELAPPTGECDAPNTWCDSGAEKTLWFQFVAPEAEKMIVSATGMNTQLALWEAENAQAVLNGNALLMAANDDHPSLTGGGSLLEANCLIAGKTYFLQMDGHNGEEGSFELRIETEGTACVSSTIQAAASLSDFSLQPNPASDLVNISLSNPDMAINCQAVLTDLSGKVVFSKNLEPNKGTVTMELGKLPAGIYFVYLQIGDAKTGAQRLAVVR